MASYFDDQAELDGDPCGPDEPELGPNDYDLTDRTLFVDPNKPDSPQGQASPSSRGTFLYFILKYIFYDLRP